jgi:hypothetical protein
MKKFSGILFVLSVIIVILFTGCSDGDDSGGGGAEFDPELYYTKTEVDALCAQIPTYDTSINEVVLALSETSYAAGNTITFDNTAIAGFYQISVTNAVANNAGYVVVYIGTSSTDYSAYTIYAPDNNEQTMSTILRPLPDNSSANLRVWYDAGNTGGTLGTNLFIGVGCASFLYKSHD